MNNIQESLNSGGDSTDLELNLQSLKEQDILLQELNEKILDLIKVEDIKDEMLKVHSYSYKITGTRLKAEAISGRLEKWKWGVHYNQNETIKTPWSLHKTISW